ncbi:MAG TPA: hypothetical protein VFL91_28430 [Thermomicrobiales bacterium]|nr:hypothetical protein [Thermomicrobiales bacterium]
MIRRWLVLGGATLAGLLAFALPLVAVAANPTVMVHDAGSLGQILTDPQGKTLYRYTRDTPNVSNCYDQCATAWPPYTTTDSPTLPDGVGGNLTLTTRKDGSKQVTYNGTPLYYYAKDTKAGDTTGQNVGQVWFVVAPLSSAQAVPNTGAGGTADTAMPLLPLLAGALGALLLALGGATAMRLHRQ